MPESLIFVPLLVGDVPLGVLSIQNLAPGAYDDEAQHTLQLIANHVASALSNIRLFTDLDLLSKTGELLTGQLTAEEVLQRVVTRIQEATGCEIVVLYPYHRESDAFDLPPVTAGVLLEPDFPQPISCRRGDLPYRAVAIPEGVFLEDAAAYHGPLGIPAGPPSAFQLREKVVSLVLQPLRVGGEAVGALYLNYRNRQSFRGAQKRLIQSLAIFAAIAIKNAWAFSDQGRRRERELEVLRTIDQKLNRSVSLHEVLKTILVEANGIIEADHATILLLDEQGQLRFRAHLNMPPQDTGTGIIRLAFEQKRPVLVDDVASPPWSDRYVEAYPGTVSELDVPLLDGTAAVGVLNFESSRPN
ncbi:MAG TPA: GAF domain-containing protein, partial [Thermoanaerobaculia bacterium]|nr:GAF domain-containing protein [Thermoanaerobaculia bacterium]